MATVDHHADLIRPATLKRSLSFWLVMLYGLGTTIGAGIFVLVGKVAGVAGLYAPVAFLVAALLAGAAALAFAELSGRYPLSAGEAVYVHEGFAVRWLALLVGLAVALAGLISAATIARGFVGYLNEFVALPPPVAIAGVLVLLGLVAAWGIAESVTLAALFTLAEAGALVAVIVAGLPVLAELPARTPELLPPFETVDWTGILAGAVLAFYAFIGFEDMVNVAEEVRDAPRILPRAILVVLVLTAVLYVGVALVAVLALPPAELAASEAPLAAVFHAASGLPPTAINLVAIVAVLNGALVQLIMAARVLYGLADRGWLPSWLAVVNPHTRTPLRATAIVAAICLVLALAFPLVELARATAYVTLTIFALVNLALFRLKGRAPTPAGRFAVPRWVTLAGFAGCVAMLLFDLVRLLG
ncbi:MAG: amino acid permease [Alphaproteobacteria bacterium]